MNRFAQAHTRVVLIVWAKSDKLFQTLWETIFFSELGIKHNRYAFCCVARVGEKVIPLPVHSCSEGIVSYPELANQPFRRSHFHRFENALSKP